MSRIIGIAIALLWIMPSKDLRAQDCFADYLSQGKTAYEDLQFEQALNLFNAARICPENTQAELTEVNDWIARANNGYIDAIKAARDAAIESEERALKAQQEAERQATLSEARRLADLANQELLAGNQDAALGLAYLAFSSVEDDATGPVELAFGNAVARSTEVQMEHDAPVVDLGIIGLDHIWGKSLDGSVKIWDRRGGETGAIASSVGRARDCLSINGQSIAWIGADGNVQTYDVSGRLLQKFNHHDAPILAVSSASVGNTFATADRNGTIYLHGETGLLKTLEEGDPVYQVSFTSDGSGILVRSASPKARLLELDGLSTIELAHEAPIFSISESPESNLFVTAGADSKAILWDSEGTKTTELLHDHPVTHAVFSPDGKTIATADLSGNIALWEKSGTLIRNLQGPASAIDQLLWAPDGQLLTAADNNHRIWLWESNAAPAAVIQSHTNDISSMDFSPDSDLLLTTSQDGTAWLWDRQGRAQMQILKTDSPVYKGMFSSDGQQILVASGDHHVLSVRNPITVYAELKANPPEFTQAQKEQFGLN